MYFSLPLAHALLALAICAAWLPDVHVARRFRLPPWLAIFLLAVGSGLFHGQLEPAALGSLGAFLLCAWLAARQPASCVRRLLFGCLTALLALALAMHRLPGFSNPVLLEGVIFSAGAKPLTLYANFDKGAVGLVLLALFCRRSASFAEFVSTLRRTLPVMPLTLLAVLGLATVLGHVQPDFKLPAAIWIFLLANLFFTVAAEEAFFRGWLQERLATAIAAGGGNAIAIGMSALLFGAAHAGGGLLLAGLASLAGLGYALAYARTRRIEGAIAAHFLFNAVHLVAFTYPYR